MKKTVLLLMLLLSSIMFGGTNYFLTVQQGDKWEHKVTIVPVLVVKSATPQIAVWVEDSNGNLIENIYVTKMSAGWLNSNEREEALPVWRGKMTGRDLDGTAGATYTKGFSYVRESKKEISTKIRIYAEINNSFDYNEYYTKDGKNGTIKTGVNGQPSLIYFAEVDRDFSGTVKLEIAGIGEVTKKSSTINTDVSKVSTAKDIIKNISVRIKRI